MFMLAYANFYNKGSYSECAVSDKDKKICDFLKPGDTKGKEHGQ